MIPPLNYTDFYKVGHFAQYPKGTEYIYSNFTARSSSLDGVDKIVVFGIQYFCKEYLIKRFNEGFFFQPKEKVVRAYQRRLDNALGKSAIDTSHIVALHDLGYLPIEIKALHEGTLCPIRIPFLTIRNTIPEFFWLTNFLETVLSDTIWHPVTIATIAHQYKKLLTQFAEETSDQPELVDWQGHDFSMRGQTSLESACASGAAHLLSFFGTDTVPGIDFLEEYYGANSDKEMVGGSVPASEHSTISIGMQGNEEETFKRLITEVYPKGVFSYVSDTWDYWGVLTKIAPKFREQILNRDGKLVFRGDSGDPIKIIVGDSHAPLDSPEYKGSAQLLYECFGGERNSKGYIELNPKVGLIYGDSITYERCLRICQGLKDKGFASTNIVFGIGSHTYQRVNRDTFGFAVKATWGQVNGEARNIFKQPKTDDGLKNSAKGLLAVTRNEEGNLILHECCSVEQEKGGLLRKVFKDSMLRQYQSLSEIRAKLKKETELERQLVELGA